MCWDVCRRNLHSCRKDSPVCNKKGCLKNSLFYYVYPEIINAYAHLPHYADGRFHEDCVF